MCKIAIIPHIPPKLESNAWKFARVLAPLMGENDRDGFGYFALGEQGLYGERWLRSKNAFKTRNTQPRLSPKYAELLGPSLEFETTYNHFGTSSRASCIALHARMATSGLGMDNTHPFLTPDGRAALIHNGVINSPPVADMPTSTCDSEVILTRYAREGVPNDAKAISRVSESLEGYFACAAIALDSQNRWILDIFKDARAYLQAVEVPALGGIVFCTDANMIRKACKTLRWKFGKTFTVRDCRLIRFDAHTGSVLTQLEFKPPKVRTYTPPASTGALANDDAPFDEAEVQARLEALEAESRAVDDYMRDPYYYRRGA